MTGVKTKWGDKQRAEEEVSCSLVKEPSIYLEVIAKQKISYLMEEYISREWLAYLLGEKSEEGDFFVEDILVPPHKESFYASAEAEPFHIPDTCIGVIHSHHGMGAFHSGTDQSHVDRNFPVSITVARGTEGSLNYDAVSTQDTPCGKAVALKGNVMYVQPEPSFNAEDWLKDAKENIDKGEKQTVVYGADFYRNRTWRDGKWVEDDNLGSTQKSYLPQTTIPPKGNRKKGTYSKKVIDQIRQQVFQSRGVMLTRSQIEGILDTTPLAFGGEAD